VTEPERYVSRHRPWVRWVVWLVVLALLLPVIISTVMLIS
jgi:hypothetical protein